jgi:hypothetical protein
VSNRKKEYEIPVDKTKRITEVRISFGILFISK